MNDEDKFDFSYIAPTEAERREIESIRKQYTTVPEKEGRLEQLRRLNKKVTLPPVIVSLIIGIVGTLIFGMGMCFAMRVIGESLMAPAVLMAVGVVIGCAGIGLCIANYFIYKAILNRNRKKYGGQIIELSNELLNKNQEKE